MVSTSDLRKNTLVITLQSNWTNSTPRQVTKCQPGVATFTGTLPKANAPKPAESFICTELG